jgi:hypothetical protein
MNQPQPQDTVSELIARTTGAMAAAGPGELAPWIFARCWMAAARFEYHGHDAGDLERALADFDTVPADFPSRPKLATLLAAMQMRVAMETDDSEAYAKVERLAAVANTDPQPMPFWPPAYANMRITTLLRDALKLAPDFDPRAALAEIERHAALLGEDGPHGTGIKLARLALSRLITAYERAQTLPRPPDRPGRSPDRPAPRPAAAPEARRPLPTRRDSTARWSTSESR